MDLERFLKEFDVVLTNYRYHPNGHILMATQEVLGDACDVSWFITCRANEKTKTFGVAYAVRDKELTQEQIINNAWKLREPEILQWAATIHRNETIINKKWTPSV